MRLVLVWGLLALTAVASAEEPVAGPTLKPGTFIKVSYQEADREGTLAGRLVLADDEHVTLATATGLRKEIRRDAVLAAFVRRGGSRASSAGGGAMAGLTMGALALLLARRDDWDAYGYVALPVVGLAAGLVLGASAGPSPAWTELPPTFRTPPLRRPQARGLGVSLRLGGR